MLAPVAILLLIPGVSWGIGRQLESQLEQYREPLLSAMPWMRITSRRFERGVFSSREEIDVEIMLDADGRRFTIVNELQHGPFPGSAIPALAHVHSTLRLQGAADEAARKLFGDRSPVTVDTRLGLLGGGHSVVTVPDIDTRVGTANVHLLWRGFKGEFDFTRHMNELDATASAPLLRMQGAAGEVVELSGLAFTSHGRQIFEGLYSGSAELKLDALKAQGPAGAMIDAAGVHYAGEVPVDGEFVDVIARIGADRARISGVEYGPVHYDVSFRHLHGPTLAAVTRELRRVTEKQRAAPADAAADPRKLFDDPALLSALRQLLLAKPRLVLDQISASTPQGPFSIKGEAHFTGLQSSDMSAPFALLSKLEAQADISVPAAWASLAGSRVLPRDANVDTADPALRDEALAPDAVPAAGAAQAPDAAPAAADGELDELVRRGFVKRDGKLVTTHMEFRQGKLLLNGRSVGE